MKKTMYRLSEYRITDYENGLLWWETHHGFAMQRSGKCFLYNDLLIIGPCSHEEHGYLKGEFLDQLKTLPAWNKTKYYCLSVELLDVTTGRSLSEDFFERMVGLVTIKRAGAEAFQDEGPGTFRLDKYQITVDANGRLSWHGYGGKNRVAGGQCIIQSGVLFIGPKEYDKGGQSKQEFLTIIGGLLQWDRTEIWCRSLAFWACQPQLQRKWPRAAKRNRDTWGDRAYHEKPTAVHSHRQERPFKRLLPLGFKFQKPSWHLPRGIKIGVMYVIRLVTTGLLLGLILSIRAVKATWSWFRSFKKHDQNNNKASRR